MDLFVKRKGSMPETYAWLLGIKVAMKSPGILFRPRTIKGELMLGQLTRVHVCLN